MANKESSMAKEDERLLRAARKVMKHAHAPYSNFRVGAAFLTTKGELDARALELVGFPVEWVLLQESISLLYQFFIHTERKSPDQYCG